MEQAVPEVMDGSSFEENWKVIGSGGYNQVFKARHRQWEKDVAVKLLFNADGSSSSEEALARESKLMQSADSPYIMKVLGTFLGCRPGCGVIQVGLVMELMEGGSLDSLQKKRNRQPLPRPLVFRLVHQVAEGMKYLHSLTPALIHKDLKPDNILLDKDLNVKIIDFGIAKFADNVTAEPLQGIGSLFYAPPEARQGGATCAYDVYSYAVLVWTILHPDYYDKVPFDVSMGVTSLEEVKMEVPGLEELVELMVRCWKEDPKERPTFTECTAVTERLYEENKHGIDYYVGQVKEEQDGVVIRKYPKLDGVVILEEPRRDFQRLTLDTNTAQRDLSLSENNRKVTGDHSINHSLINVFFGRPLGGHSYPDHQDRFDVWRQVLCSERLTGRCYWEVECSGTVDIAVTYRGISRKGSFDSLLGWTDNSWSLFCDGDSYSVRHNRERTVLPVRPSSVSNRVDHRGKPVHRVAVYLDHPAGTLSFYDVSSDTKTHLYTFQTTFSEPLYAGFGVWPGCSVRLCEQR